MVWGEEQFFVPSIVVFSVFIGFWQRGKKLLKEEKRSDKLNRGGYTTISCFFSKYFFKLFAFFSQTMYYCKEETFFQILKAMKSSDNSWFFVMDQSLSKVFLARQQKKVRNLFVNNWIIKACLATLVVPTTPPFHNLSMTTFNLAKWLFCFWPI